MSSLRHALCRLAKSPGFTTAALLIIAICLGANLTIFAVIDSVLVRPLPFPDADRLVTIFNRYPKAGIDRYGATITNYYERRGRIEAFSSLALIVNDPVIVGDPGSTENMDVACVTSEFFTTVGLPPVIGRSFHDEEMTDKTNRVVILTDAYWRQRLHADPAVLERKIRIDGRECKIVGVLPPSFGFLSSQARLYIPFSSDSTQRGPDQRHSSGGRIMMVARLKPGFFLDEARAQIDAHNASVAPSYPQAKMMAETGFHSVVASLHADHVESIRPVLLLLQTGVLFLLLIGGVNLVNLLLIRASSRSREFAIRQSMGATRQHVIREVMSETLLLAFLGGLGGCVVAAFGIDLVRVLGADRLPLGAHIAFDGRVAAAALLGSLALGIIIALPIAWFNLRNHLANALQSTSRTSTASQATQRLQQIFIVVQIALAFILLSGAGLLGLSLRRVMAVPPGFRPDHLLSGEFSLPEKNYGASSARLAFADKMTTEISHQPGVVAVGVSTKLPLSGELSTKAAFTVKGYILPPGETVRAHYIYGVAGDYFGAVGIPLRQGRLLTPSELRGSERVCVVDEDFARHYWPKGDALGQRLFIGSRERPDNNAFTVVGVVGTVKQIALTEKESIGAAYFSLAHRYHPNLFAVVRANLPPETLGFTLQKMTRDLDPDIPLNNLRSMDTRIADSLVARRSPALLASIFAGVALLLAAIGTYGVLSYSVAQRQREIGVRMALGAQATQIGRQFLSVGLRLLIAGTILGFAGAWLAGRAMQTVLFDVPALHPATLVVIAALMSAVSLFACWLPARRAARVNPIEALRAE